MRSQLHRQIPEKGAGVTVHTTIGADAPYKLFAAGKILAQGEFTSPEQINKQGSRPVETGWEADDKLLLS